jgi:hypothetical protein
LTKSTSRTGRGCSDAQTTSRTSIPGDQHDRALQLELNHPRIVFERWRSTLEKGENTQAPSIERNPKNPSGFTDAEWTKALTTDLGFERFLRVMPNEWRPKLELRAAGQILSRAKARHPDTKLKNLRLVGGREASPTSH